LWVDTLCIPVAPSATLYRKRAIRLLGETFGNATAVLVLDRELEIVNSSTASFVELGIRIVSSGWAKRLWTLQESALANLAPKTRKGGATNLYFQMQDGPFPYRQELERVSTEERRLLFDYDVSSLLLSRIPSVNTFRGKEEARFLNMLSAIAHRSTSKIEDVPVCVASILGLDLSSILSAPTTDERMASFYLLLRYIPTSVLWIGFDAAPRRLPMAPFRWALPKITDCEEEDYQFRSSSLGILEADGLHVKFRGFVFSFEEPYQCRMMPENFTIRALDANAVEYARELGTMKQLDYIADELEMEIGPVLVYYRFPDDPLPIPKRSRMALLFPPPAKMDEFASYAVVVEIEQEMTRNDDGESATEYYATIVGHVCATYPPSGTKQEGGTVFDGIVTSADQRWCIT
jgi:hypothetical protein